MLPRVLSFVLPLSIYTALALTTWGIYRERRKVDRYALIIGIAAFLTSLAVRPNQHLLFFDEDIYIQIASNLSQAPVAQLTLSGTPKDIQVSTYYKEPAGFPVLLSFIFAVTGPREIVAFIVARALYAMAVIAVYLLGRSLMQRRGQALTAAVAFAATPAVFAFSSSAGTDLPATLFAALGVWGIVSDNGILAAGALGHGGADAAGNDNPRAADLVQPNPREVESNARGHAGSRGCTYRMGDVHRAEACRSRTREFDIFRYLRSKNIYGNIRYLLDPRMFPLAVILLAVMAVVIDRRYYGRGFLLGWLITLFIVYVAFYAGSFEINPRYSIQLTIPLIPARRVDQRTPFSPGGLIAISAILPTSPAVAAPNLRSGTRFGP